MPSFRYEAFDSSGALKRGSVKAITPQEARTKIQKELGLFAAQIGMTSGAFCGGEKEEHASKEEIKEYFESQKTKQYMKFGEVAVREPQQNETLVVICGGKVETVQKVKPDQYVIMALAVGTNAETYAIDRDIFEDKYEVVLGKDERGFSCREEMSINGQMWYRAKPIPKATIHAFRYSGETFKFIAPWGSEMLCEDGDMLARTIGKENDIYRIEKDAFAVTYKEAE